jgi:hypothetical protein
MANKLKAPGTFYYYRLRNNDNDNVSLQVEGYMSYKTYYIVILTENVLCIQSNILSRGKIYATCIMHAIF